LTKSTNQPSFSRQGFDDRKGLHRQQIQHHPSLLGSGNYPLTMQEIGLRSATDGDAAFALHVTEACMRVYAEKTWGSWNGRANFDPALDNVIQLAGQDIGLLGIERRSDYWFLGKLYLLPTYQNRGIGGHLIERLKEDATLAQLPVRLTVLEVNPARRFYERHGFVLTHTISPRHYMEWRGH
jgi:GNAT superfamily N-acetyltransferase